MLLLKYNPVETFNFNSTIYTYEKTITRYPCYSMQILRKRKAEICVQANYENKTVKINGRKFATSINSEFTYKKCKGNRIEVSNFERFISHLKESASNKNVFYHTTEAFLLILTKGTYTSIKD